MKRTLVLIALLHLLGAGVYIAYKARSPAHDASTGSPNICPRHHIALADCPFCDKSLIQKKGQCPEHGVPEALCTRCNPALIPAFKVENDWCAGHGVPESQCVPCNPELAEKRTCAKHQIAQCPFCDTSLIQKMGQCIGHGVPEALCSRCNPTLIPGFKAEGDWCGGHNLPESQCLICNPELAEKKQSPPDEDKLVTTETATGVTRSTAIFGVGLTSPRRSRSQ